MSGEPQRDDDLDFPDDFILEDDAVAKEDDLDSLFDEPAKPAVPPVAGHPPASAVNAAAPTGTLPPEADDVLFTDHTPGLKPSESFQSGPPFQEEGRTTWRGDELELDTPGVPVDDERGSALERGQQEAELPSKALEAELDALLQRDDELALDSEEELELIETADSLLDETTAGDTFVIDDGNGMWQEGEVPVAGAPVAVDADGGLVPAANADVGDEAQSDEQFAPLNASSDADASTESAQPGWEPLPGTSMDALAEVEEVGRVDEEDASSGDGADVGGAAVAVAAGLPRPELAAVGAGTEDHDDLYAGDETSQPAAVVGGPWRKGRTLRLVASLAASIAVAAAGVVVVFQPELLGLRFTPEQVQSVQVSRPRIDVVVAPPVVPAADPVASPTNPPQPVQQPEPPTPVVDPVPVIQQPPVVVVEPPPVVVTTPEIVPPPPVQTTPDPTPVPTPMPEPTPMTPIVQAPSPERPQGWPVPVASLPETVKGTTRPKPLVRLGNDLLAGMMEPRQEVRQVVDGMVPGSRAFAQLQNGNYFIGSIKFADRDRLTLRIETGEVTLQVAALAKLMMLGSADYESLQKATSGFVRLTNKNRLVGGILSSIADDHVVLEFRSNRVMLPKSAVGEVVQGEGEQEVRLGTTQEEDDWLRKLAERQLGTGKGPEEKRPNPPPAGGSGPR